MIEPFGQLRAGDFRGVLEAAYQGSTSYLYFKVSTKLAEPSAW
jgi:hypothetical protein